MNDELKYPHPNPSKGEGLKDRDHAPYPGLRPYREDEKAKFFGRDVDAEILIDKVLTNRLTLLFAASGVGKSSLLQAAVIPHLKSKTGENLTVVYHTDWVSDPVRSVRDAVLQAFRTEGLLPEHSEEAEFGEKLPDLLAFCEVFVRPPLVLILDQFEEFFRYQRHQTGFRDLIDQLTTIITDKSLPVHLILSMREDFALELNAFKPKLPTILFENFYRLEKLGRQAVRDAIVIPAEQRGFTYEPELLKQLLADLLSREMDRQPNSPVVELLETVEPPYMQIVCARLWELNEGDSEKVLWLASYEKAGRAKGILKNYLDGVLQRFSFAEKQLASAAFDHLVSLRGVKMAYTAKGLAETVRVDEGELAKVLKRLESVGVLREIPQQNELWYELYHDMFSGSIDDWNSAWKERRISIRSSRARRTKAEDRRQASEEKNKIQKDLVYKIESLQTELKVFQTKYDMNINYLAEEIERLKYHESNYRYTLRSKLHLVAEHLQATLLSWGEAELEAVQVDQHELTEKKLLLIGLGEKIERLKRRDLRYQDALGIRLYLVSKHLQEILLSWGETQQDLFQAGYAKNINHLAEKIEELKRHK